MSPVESNMPLRNWRVMPLAPVLQRQQRIGNGENIRDPAGTQRLNFQRRPILRNSQDAVVGLRAALSFDLGRPLGDPVGYS